MDARTSMIIATINLIEKGGVLSLTSRSIAKEAGVNVASINYYFGSKDKLVRMALEQAITNGLDDIRDVVGRDGLGVLDKISIIAHYLCHGMALYPNLTKSNLYPVIYEGDYTGPFIVQFNELIDNFLTDSISEIPKEFIGDIRVRVSHLFNALFMVAVAPGLFAGVYKVDLQDEKQRTEYVESLLTNYLNC